MAKKENIMAKKTGEELTTLLVETREKLRKERFAAAGARPEDSDAPKKLRKEIARILTEQRTREAAK